VTGAVGRQQVAPQPVPIAPPANYGSRADGTAKGQGYFGELKRPDGGVSTEISVGMQIEGKETEVPLLVPTLTEKEKQYLLNKDPKTLDFKSPEMQPILDKAEAHAKRRLRAGKSPFASSREMLR
jgi:hypothetical protein